MARGGCGLFHTRAAGPSPPTRCQAVGPPWLLLPFAANKARRFFNYPLCHLDSKQWRRGRQQLFVCCFLKSQNLFLSSSGAFPVPSGRCVKCYIMKPSHVDGVSLLCLGGPGVGEGGRETGGGGEGWGVGTRLSQMRQMKCDLQLPKWC